MLIEEFSIKCKALIDVLGQIQKSDDPRAVRAKAVNARDDLGDIVNLHSSVADDVGDDELTLMSKLMSALIETSGFIGKQEIDEADEIADTFLRHAEFFGRVLSGERPVTV